MTKNTVRKAFSLLEVSVVIFILGLLLAAIIKGNSIYKKSKLSSARNLTENSVVNFTEGLTLWLDATSTRSFVKENMSDGDKIASWKSISTQSSEDFEVTQTGADSVKPTYKVDQINGLPALYFGSQGGNDSMTKNTTFDEIFGSNEATHFFVVNVNSEGTCPIFMWGDDVGDHFVRVIMPSSSGSTAQYDFATNASLIVSAANFSNAGISTIINKPFIATFIKNASDVILRLDGTQVLSNAHSTTISRSESQDFTIGSNTYTICAGSSFGELIFFNRALDDEERDRIEKYLSKKWGIELAS